MRVLLVADWPRLPGGTEVYVTRVRDSLEAAGDDVRVLTGSTGSRGDGRASYVALGSDRLTAQAFLQVANPFAYARVRSALRDFSPDGVLVTTFLTHLSPAVLAPLRGYAAILLALDYRPVCPIALKLLPDGTLCEQPAGLVCWREGCVSLAHWLRDRPRYALLRAGLSGVGCVLACSEWMRRALSEAGIESETIALPVLPPGDGYARVPAPEPRLLYLGRLRHEKGVDLLVRAFARVRAASPRAVLHVVGDGPQRVELERLVAGLGLSGSVVFQGWLGQDRIELELSEAWALVAPSRWAEPLGLSAVEAVVHGVPVVASDAGGFRETLEAGVTGLLVKRADEEGLAAALVRVCERRAFPGLVLPQTAVRAARERHDPDRHAALLREAFRRVGGGKDPAPT